MQFNVWAEAERFHEITPFDIKKDEEGFFEIRKGNRIHWQSSLDCTSIEQAIKEFEQDTQDYYFELVIEHDYQMKFEQLH